MHRVFLRLALLLAFACPVFAANCSPMMGLGSIQVFDNNGKPLTAGVLYSFQAGTTTQQATFVDSTCTNANQNPIPFTNGARASIWLNSGQFYKFVLCQQNDGAACAPADTLFSVDQVPGNLNGQTGGGGGSPFTGTFISGSANPATSGILRLASGDTLCFRNAANSANLCLSKDTSDVFLLASGAFKLPEISCSASGVGFDYLCADSSHRWKMANNGGSQFLIPGIASAGTVNHLVILAANGIDIQDGGAPPLTQESSLVWCGGGLVVCGNLAAFAENTSSAATGYEALLTNAHTLIRFTYNLAVAASGCSTPTIIAVQDVTAASNLTTATLSNGQTPGFIDSGALSISLPAGHKFMVGTIQAPSGCATPPQVNNVTAIYQ